MDIQKEMQTQNKADTNRIILSSNSPFKENLFIRNQSVVENRSPIMDLNPAFKYSGNPPNTLFGYNLTVPKCGFICSPPNPNSTFSPYPRQIRNVINDGIFQPLNPRNFYNESTLGRNPFIRYPYILNNFGDNLNSRERPPE